MQSTIFLTGVTNKLTERWVGTLFTPSLVFWAGGSLVALQTWGWENSTRTAFISLPNSLQLAVLIFLFLLITLSGFIVQRFDFLAIRLLEGYWPKIFRPVAQWLIVQQKNKHHAQRAYWQILENKTVLSPTEATERASIDWNMSQKPRSPNDFMPTELGNVIRAAEIAPTISYGLNAIVCWPRLWMVLPEQARKDIAAARAELDTAARTWLWSKLFCAWAVAAFWTDSFYVALWPLPVGGLSAWLSYRWALSAAKSYANLIRAAYDLYRFRLYEAMDIKIPKTQAEEILIAQKLNIFLLRGY